MEKTSNLIWSLKNKDCTKMYCRISYREGLGMSPSIMGLTTQDPYILKEHTDRSKTSKFSNKCMGCRTLVRKSIHFFANFEVFEWPYLVQYWPN